MNVIAGISFLQTAFGSAHQEKDKKAGHTRVEIRPASNHIDLEQRFKKTAEFFSKIIECIRGLVELNCVFCSDLVIECQITFVEGYRQFV
mgnify:CR=1 FL=1